MNWLQCKNELGLFINIKKMENKYNSALIHCGLKYWFEYRIWLPEFEDEYLLVYWLITWDEKVHFLDDIVKRLDALLNLHLSQFC